METATDVFGHINNVLFVLLALLSAWRWRKTGGSAARFAALTFAVLAMIAVVGELTPDDAQGTYWDWVQKLTIAALLLFPYFLYRFATSFAQIGRIFDVAAGVVTGAMIVWTLTLPPFPGPGDPRPAAFQLYLFGLLGQWTLLSFVAAIRLWVAGRGQPGVARRRMRLLAIGTTAMNVALLIAGLAPPEGALGIRLTTQIFAFLSALAFFLGFDPPASLRAAWRRSEEEAFRNAVRDAVSAREPEEITQRLLPHIAAIVGAKRVELLDPTGQLVAAFDAPGMHRVGPGPGQEIRRRLPDGWLMLSASSYTPFFGDDEVRLAEFLGSLMNIAVERARLSRLQDLILRTAGEGIYGIDRDGRVIFINPSGAQMFGWSESELVGQDMHRLTHHSHPDGSTYPRSECPIYRSLQDGQVHRRDTEVFWRQDGSAFPVEYISSPIMEGDAISGVVVTFTDISERKLAEAASTLAYEREREARIVVEKTNKEMESFVYTVSHDLNSPLVSISGFLNYLEADYGTLLPEQGQFFLQRISASARYMHALIRDLLEFSRVGRLETSSDRVDLAALLPVIVDEVLAAEPSLRVEYEDLPVISMNPHRARQLFTNLLHNAARYAGPDPSVEIKIVDTIEGKVCLSVADNGPGIPSQEHERAFEVFQRLQEQPSEEGTGIGLAICKRIVESSGGEIWLADAARGADFRMTLPLLQHSRA